MSSTATLIAEIVARQSAGTELLSATVVDRLPLGAIVLDRAGTVVLYNSYEEALARRRREDVIGRHFFRDVARCCDVPAIAGAFEAHVASNTLAADVEHVFRMPFLPRPRDVRLLLRSFEAAGEPYGLILIEDVTARKDIERERDKLLSILVHDLKNPLTAVLGFAQLLVDPSSPAETREWAGMIKTSAIRMRDLISASLAEMRPAPGAPRRPEAVNLHALVLSAIGGALPRARERGIRLFYNGELNRAEFPEVSVAVRGHVERLASVVENLLSNAVKYARGEVRIGLDLDVESDGARVRLSVADDGRGIPAELHRRVFEEGFQAPGSLPGHGIGLFSVQRAVADHGGTISVSSEPGKGARFDVLLPA